MTVVARVTANKMLDLQRELKWTGILPLPATTYLDWTPLILDTEDGKINGEEAKPLRNATGVS